jgi:hypothetical protein
MSPVQSLLSIRLVQMKPVQRLFWGRNYRPLKIVLMGAEAGIPLTHQSTDHLCK